MYNLILRCDAADKDRLVAELWEQGTAGIVELDLSPEQYELRACFSQVFPADVYSAYGARWEEIEKRDWVRDVMESWEPLPVGRRFYVAPDWRDDPTPAGRMRLVVHPGLALGTGYHPTTQMCLEAMEEYLRPGETYFEWGCGTGILSQGASLLGAGKIIACDIDADAIAAAVESFRRAGVQAGLYAGSIESIADGSVDLLAANISAPAIMELAGEMARCLVSGGRAVVSGFEPHRVSEVRSAVVAKGFVEIELKSRDDWACLVLRLK